MQQPVEDEDGWSYLHLVVSTYVRLTAAGHDETAKLLIRAVYRLALTGIDVNARDAVGRTALVLAAAQSTNALSNMDQSLVTHLLRVGQSPVNYLAPAAKAAALRDGDILPFVCWSVRLSVANA